MQQKKADSKKTLGQKKLKKAEKADATHATGIFKDTVPSCLFSLVQATEETDSTRNSRSKKATPYECKINNVLCISTYVTNGPRNSATEMIINRGPFLFLELDIQILGW